MSIATGSTGPIRQVMLSARELKPALLPPNAQTWVNRHVLFTHGNGVGDEPGHPQERGRAARLLSRRTSLPSPPAARRSANRASITAKQTDTYVIVKGSTPEFDYPKGKDNVYAPIRGRGGVPVGSVARRALFALVFQRPEPAAHALYHRPTAGSCSAAISRNACATIAPFLRLDQDPYLGDRRGPAFWMQDAYTTSSYFPYAQSRLTARSSITSAIQSRSSSTPITAPSTFISRTPDPIAATYSASSQVLFKPLSAMPQDLQRHIRYPEDLFLHPGADVRDLPHGQPRGFL